MVISLPLKITLAAVLFCFSSYSLWAQDNSGQTSFRMELRFIQRLTWIGDEYAMRYEVIIERQEQGQYRRFHQVFTQEEFIEVSLPPGNFRFQVIPYDFLGLPVPAAEWVNFEVLSGGSRLAEGEHEVVLINPGDEASRTEIIITTPNMTPQDTDSDTVVIIYEYEQIAAASETKFDIYFGVFWVPILPVYNINFFHGGNMSLLGAQMRLGMVYSGRRFLNPGVELGASWRMIDDSQYSHYFTVDLNFLGQIPFLNGRMALNFRAGAGVFLVSDIQSEVMPRLATFHVNIGISFLALVARNLYIEAGADLPQFIANEHYGYFRPWIGIGVRF